MTCPTCEQLQAELEASRLRNSGLKAKVLCLETDLGNAQSLLAGAYQRAPAAVSPEQFPGQFDEIVARHAPVWRESTDQQIAEAHHRLAVARNRRARIPHWWRRLVDWCAA